MYVIYLIKVIKRVTKFKLKLNLLIKYTKEEKIFWYEINVINDNLVIYMSQKAKDAQISREIFCRV